MGVMATGPGTGLATFLVKLFCRHEWELGYASGDTQGRDWPAGARRDGLSHRKVLVPQVRDRERQEDSDREACEWSTAIDVA